MKFLIGAMVEYQYAVYLTFETLTGLVQVTSKAIDAQSFLTSPYTLTCSKQS
jgi:hypothetical protein